ncbi:MAG TPA: FAD-dependent monooxygenase [Burkholderiales bacterium]|nr:FAD-dependent monooxygenase [Burkholderiales bacterium]
MRVAIVGAGPAGLYLAYLLKRRDRAADVRVFEQNPAGATFGFGVVFSDRALEFLREDDPQTYQAITPAMESWSDITLDLEGEGVAIDGVGFSAVGRLELLRLLQKRVEAVGVAVRYERSVASLEELGDADLVVGADGVNSLVRRTYEKEFGATVGFLTNKFAWYGTTKRFETLTQTFRRSADGAFNAHHYRYSPKMSTFIVETDAATWQRAGFASMDEASAKAYLERVFADVLDGHALVSNKSVWRNFPKVRNERWHAGNAVLMGDALHTAHFSIGSGTRLAMEDAIALARAIGAHAADAGAAARAYEAARRPVLDKLTKAADASGEWYERFAEHMRLPPLEFAMSYITRSGRVDLNRLRAVSPVFVAEYERRAGRPD